MNADLGRIHEKDVTCGTKGIFSRPRFDNAEGVCYDDRKFGDKCH